MLVAPIRINMNVLMIGHASNTSLNILGYGIQTVNNQRDICLFVATMPEVCRDAYTEYNRG
jgi:hypothetical protein